MLPFFPSPLRDDGYDIANYVEVNPLSGTLNDFREFQHPPRLCRFAVLIELANRPNAGDQHPPLVFKGHNLPIRGSPDGIMYVWSDTDQKFDGVAHHIFFDTERSSALDLGCGGLCLLLASLLLAPARFKLR